MSQFQITSLTRVGAQEEILLKIVPGVLARFLGAKTEILKFRGSGTVWHQVPTGRRPGTMMEGRISDLVAGYQMRNFPA